MKKAAPHLILLIVLFSCNKENNIAEQYNGFYAGSKIIEFAYDSVTTNNTIHTVIKFDTVYSKIELKADGNFLDIIEFDENSSIIKLWDNAEINNSGDIAYFTPTQTAYGDIAPTTLSFTTYYVPAGSNDTNMVVTYYTLTK